MTPCVSSSPVPAVSPASSAGPSWTPAARPDATHLEALAHRALAPGRESGSRGVPDGFRYVIDVDGRSVHLADPPTSPRNSAN
ncbi:hypothetical protein GCM10020000_55720 [Streptomyces olivoverticillatus]